MQGIIPDDSLTANTKLYRYVSLSQFISFVETKKIYLTKMTEWEDPWELPTKDLPIELNGKIERPLHSITDDMFGMCWSLKSDSDALWRIYSSNKEGILMQTSVKKFKLMENQIKFGILAHVIYYDNLLQILNNKEKIKFPMFKDGLLKRNAFEHEKEVRLVTLNDGRCLGDRIKNEGYIKTELNPIDFLEGILIDPRATDWYVDVIQKYCKNAGFTIIPKKSNLYSTNIHKETGLIQQITTKNK